MQTIKISKIVIPENRVRKTFDDDSHTELAENILEKGLFHAILLRGDGKTLIAGERRLRAVMEIYGQEKTFTYNGEAVTKGTIPFTKLHGVGNIAEREAELEENTKRQNLSWQEEAATVAALHKLRTEQAEAKGETYNRGDTAEEYYKDKPLGTSRSDVSDNLIISEYLDDDDVKKAKNKKEAISIIEKKLIKEHRRVLAEEYNVNKSNSPHTVTNGDLREEMVKLPDGHFDLIIADPPYGIAADKFNNQSAEEHDYNDSETYADEIMKVIATEGFRVTTKRAHLYLFCDINRFAQVKEIFEKAGWYVWKWPMIWYRGSNIGILPRPEHGPRRCYEAVMYAIKGDKPLQAVMPDVLVFSHDKTVERGAHKPVEVYESLINRSCLPGSEVLDPCCGTGPILTAADRANVTATAIEVDKAAFVQALERLSSEDEDVLGKFTGKGE